MGWIYTGGREAVSRMDKKRIDADPMTVHGMLAMENMLDAIHGRGRGEQALGTIQCNIHYCGHFPSPGVITRWARGRKAI